MSECNCVYEEFCKLVNGGGIFLPKPCAYRKDSRGFVQVLHGRWIHDQVEGCNPFVDSLPIWIDVMQCSVCNEYIEGSHGTNYCPNCGADMRERKDGE